MVMDLQVDMVAEVTIIRIIAIILGLEDMAVVLQEAMEVMEDMAVVLQESLEVMEDMALVLQEAMVLEEAMAGNTNINP